MRTTRLPFDRQITPAVVAAPKDRASLVFTAVMAAAIVFAAGASALATTAPDLAWTELPYGYQTTSYEDARQREDELRVLGSNVVPARLFLAEQEVGSVVAWRSCPDHTSRNIAIVAKKKNKCRDISTLAQLLPVN